MDKNEVKEVASELIGLEGNKIFRTIKYLTIKPGQVITEYCSGEKQKYLSPSVYFFGVSGIVLYLQSLSGMSDLMRTAENLVTLKEMFSDLGFTVSETQLIKLLNTLENQPLMTILMLPVNLVVTWGLFKKHNPSFKQSSWFVLFISAQSALLYILPLLCFWFINRGAFVVFISNILGPIIIAYNIWAAMQFYKIEMGRAILLIFVRLIILMPFLVLSMVAIFYLILNYVE